MHEIDAGMTKIPWDQDAWDSEESMPTRMRAEPPYPVGSRQLPEIYWYMVSIDILYSI